MAVKTKSQLEAQVKELKEMVRELKTNQKTDDIGDLPENGFVVARKNGNFTKFDVQFDPETYNIKILSETDLGKDIAIVSFKLREILSLKLYKI